MIAALHGQIAALNRLLLYEAWVADDIQDHIQDHMFEEVCDPPCTVCREERMCHFFLPFPLPFFFFSLLLFFSSSPFFLKASTNAGKMVKHSMLYCTSPYLGLAAVSARPAPSPSRRPWRRSGCYDCCRCWPGTSTGHVGSVTSQRWKRSSLQGAPASSTG